MYAKNLLIKLQVPLECSRCSIFGGLRVVKTCLGSDKNNLNKARREVGGRRRCSWKVIRERGTAY